MATAQPSPITRYLRGLAVSHLASLSDAQLLQTFTARRDEAAFTALVRRHGPLVLAACRRVLADWDAAQDCFQTTFIVLARRAGSLERPETLGPLAEAQAQGGNAMLIKAKVAALLLAVAVAGGGIALSGQRVPAAVRGSGVPKQTARDTAPENERILFLEGSTRFLLGDYRAADVAFSRVAEQTPAGSFAAPAAELAILARHFHASGAAEAEKVAAGRQLIKTALDTRQRADGQGRRLDRLPPRQAKKDLETADFYERTGHPGSARFYFELVCRRYPGTPFAATAAERLRRLSKPASEPSRLFQTGPQVGNLRPRFDFYRLGCPRRRLFHPFSIPFSFALHYTEQDNRPPQATGWPALPSARPGPSGARLRCLIAPVSDHSFAPRKKGSRHGPRFHPGGDSHGRRLVL